MWHCDDDAARFVCLLNDHTKRKLLPIERMRRSLNQQVLECGAMASCSESDTSQSFSNQVSRHLLKRQWKKKRRKQMQRISDPWLLERPHVEHAGKSNTSQQPKVREPRRLPSPSPERRIRTLHRCDSVATRIIE